MIKKPFLKLIETVEKPELESAFVRAKAGWKYASGQERKKDGVFYSRRFKKSLHTHPQDTNSRAFIVKNGRIQNLRNSIEAYASHADVLDLLEYGKSGHIAFTINRKTAGALLMVKKKNLPMELNESDFSKEQNLLLKHLKNWHTIRIDSKEGYIFEQDDWKSYLKSLAFLKNPENWKKAGLLIKRTVLPGYEIKQNPLGFDYIVPKEKQ